MATHFDGTTEERQALDVYIKLTRAAESSALRINAKLQRFNLTVSQFGVLEALFHLGPLQPGELATKILKSSGNMTPVLENLEKRALVRRAGRGDPARPCPGRRRYVCHPDTGRAKRAQPALPHRRPAVPLSMMPLSMMPLSFFASFDVELD